MISNFKTATSVFVKTAPFVLLRFGIGILLGALSTLYFGVIGYFLYSFVEAGTVSWAIAVGGLLVSLVLFYYAWQWVVKYLLYLVKAGHIAVIAEAVDTGEVPPNQIQYGTEQVTEQFAQATALFGVDQVVKGVLTQFNRGVMSLSNLVSFIPALAQLIRVAGKAVRIAASYLDEAVIAYMFLNPTGNRWKSATDGLVIYAKTWKPVLAATMTFVGAMYALGLTLFLLLTPLAAVLSGLSLVFELFGWVVVGGITVAIYSGVLKPYVKTVVITTFLIESRGKTPDAETRAWLAERSETFRELQGKADEGDPDVTGGSADHDSPATA